MQSLGGGKVDKIQGFNLCIGWRRAVYKSENEFQEVGEDIWHLLVTMLYFQSYE